MLLQDLQSLKDHLYHGKAASQMDCCMGLIGLCAGQSVSDSAVHEDLLCNICHSDTVMASDT